MFAKNDEEKRNRLWKTAISVSTLVIILIAVFFVIKLFTSNPLEGTWVREDSDLMLTISGEDQAVVLIRLVAVYGRKVPVDQDRDKHTQQ